MAYSEYIAKTILDSFENNIVTGKEKYGVSFCSKLQQKQDVIDTVDKLISENKIKATVKTQGSSFVVFDERF